MLVCNALSVSKRAKYDEYVKRSTCDVVRTSLPSCSLASTRSATRQIAECLGQGHRVTTMQFHLKCGLLMIFQPSIWRGSTIHVRPGQFYLQYIVIVTLYKPKGSFFAQFARIHYSIQYGIIISPSPVTPFLFLYIYIYICDECFPQKNFLECGRIMISPWIPTPIGMVTCQIWVCGQTLPWSNTHIR